MSRNIRVVGIVLLAMFLALFGSSTYIQFVQEPELVADGRNTRTLLASYEVQRGPILVDGNPIAYSEADGSSYMYQRVYTDGEVYAPITGYYSANQGATQLEEAMNAELSGTADSQFFTSLRALFTGEEPAGAAIETTINPAAQQAAWDALEGRPGAVFAYNPETGAIYAMASTPSYDPNTLAMHDDATVIENYNALINDPSNPMINRAIGGNMNPPGSVFKLVVAAAALEEGIVTADSELDNPESWTPPGTTKPVYNPNHGQKCGSGEKTTLHIALQYSCNIPFAQLAVQLGDEKIRAMAEAFGFNSSVSIPMESDPSVYPTEDLDDAFTAQTGFGQFEVRTTPLQMAMVAGTIANGGDMIQPTLIEQIMTPSLQVVQGPQVESMGTVISQETATALTSMMQDSVANGVASNAQIAGVDVAGKTGTAENGEGEPYSLWFTGFAELDGQQVAVAVVLEDGGGMGQSGTGNGLAATIGQQVIKAVLEL
ncbi:peptidoglycan D,D-transpeptidase FtsI family protein [Gulosibacter molinativorax]|uniref:Penicillin-binding protein 2 n=1 Tax=Gulosibacter molinativorax TaxID=256821 RepID=A0ABT7C7S1_9MICO|nr:penicillin-binding transpeptidase domain-containing protein [Gulosibacter molinativorax]MDJ1371253.1 penicillin-binding protein 2 [Gulosibacter molinativorax]QUY63069.1 Penicillin-binding protein [Gulosibacter molinativorax]